MILRLELTSTRPCNTMTLPDRLFALTTSCALQKITYVKKKCDDTSVTNLQKYYLSIYAHVYESRKRKRNNSVELENMYAYAQTRYRMWVISFLLLSNLHPRQCLWIFLDKAYQPYLNSKLSYCDLQISRIEIVR